MRSRCCCPRSGDDITNICRDAALNGMRRVTAGRSPLEIAEMKRQGHVSAWAGAVEFCLLRCLAALLICMACLFGF